MQSTQLQRIFIYGDTCKIAKFFLMIKQMRLLSFNQFLSIDSQE